MNKTKIEIDILFLGNKNNIKNDYTINRLKKNYNVINIYLPLNSMNQVLFKDSNKDTWGNIHFDENKYQNHLKKNLFDCFELIKPHLIETKLDKIYDIELFELVKDDLLSKSFKPMKQIWFYNLFFNRIKNSNDIYIIIKDTERIPELKLLSEIAPKFSINIVGYHVEKIALKQKFKINTHRYISSFHNKISYGRLIINQISPMRIPKSKTPLVYVCRSIHNFWQLLGINKYLESNYKKNIILYGSRLKTQKELESKYSNATGVTNFSNLYTFLHSIKLAKKLNKVIDGIDYDILSKEIFHNKVFSLFKTYFKYNSKIVYWYVLANRNFFKLVNPSTVIVDHLWSIFCKANILVGTKNFNKYFIFFQHGDMQKEQIDKVFYLPIHVNKIVLWGKLFKQYLVEIGVDEKIVLSSGSPYYDMINSMKNLNRRQKSSNDRKKILYLTQPVHSGLDEVEHAEKLHWFINAAKYYEMYDFIIKPHPTEINDINYYKSIARKIDNLYIINDEIISLINQVDIVCIIYSTTGYFALYLKKILIVMEQKDRTPRSIYHEHGIAERVTNFDKFIKSISYCTSNQYKYDEEAVNIFLSKTFCDEKNKYTMFKRAEIIKGNY